MTEKKSSQRIRQWFCWGTLWLTCLGCSETYTPKPRGYFRIEPAPAVYRQMMYPTLPYTFEISTATALDTTQLNDINWWSFRYPELHATVYMNYFLVPPGGWGEMLNHARQFVSRQSAVESWKEVDFSNPSERIYARLFLLQGDCVSPLQFVLTDSLRRGFRGALYYDFSPKADSIAPVTDYLQQDMIHLIETFRWRK